MRDDTSHIDVRLGINPSYDKLCQCGIVSVNLVCGKQVWMLSYTICSDLAAQSLVARVCLILINTVWILVDFMLCLCYRYSTWKHQYTDAEEYCSIFF